MHTYQVFMIIVATKCLQPIDDNYITYITYKCNNNVGNKKRNIKDTNNGHNLEFLINAIYYYWPRIIRYTTSWLNFQGLKDYEEIDSTKVGFSSCAYK